MQGVDEDISKWEENEIFHSPETMVSFVINISPARNSHFSVGYAFLAHYF